MIYIPGKLWNVIFNFPLKLVTGTWKSRMDFKCLRMIVFHFCHIAIFQKIFDRSFILLVIDLKINNRVKISLYLKHQRRSRGMECRFISYRITSPFCPVFIYYRGICCYIIDTVSIIGFILRRRQYASSAEIWVQSNDFSSCTCILPFQR